MSVLAPNAAGTLFCLGSTGRDLAPGAGG